jgi:hypothetical protein
MKQGVVTTQRPVCNDSDAVFSMLSTLTSMWSLPMLYNQTRQAKSDISDLKIMELFVSSNFEISAPQCPVHYTHDGRGDVLESVVHQNVRLSEVIVTDILDSPHLPIMFSILDLIRLREASDPVTNCLGGYEAFPMNL